MWQLSQSMHFRHSGPRVLIQILIPEVVVPLAHHGGEVGVSAHERQRLARRHVEVAGHLVQAEAAVDAARVGRLVGLLPPAGKNHHYAAQCEGGWEIKCAPKKAIA